MFILDNSTSMSTTTGWRMGNPEHTSITGGSIQSTELRPDNDASSNYTGITRNTYVGNVIFYNPGKTYQPWVKADGSVLTTGTSYTSAHNNAARATGDRNLSSLDRTYYVPKPGTTGTALNNATNYYRYTIIRSGASHHAGRIIRSERKNKVGGERGLDNAGCDASGSGWEWKNCMYLPFSDFDRTEAEEKANFATWFSYHSFRVKAAKAGASEAFKNMGKDVRVGFRTINTTRSDGITNSNYNIPVGSATDGIFTDEPSAMNKTAWYDKLHNATTTGSTPLRNALRNTGEYFSGDGASGPYGPGTGSSQLACRQNFAILTSDGEWNGPTPSGINNADGTAGPNDYVVEAPYSDGASQKDDTLADVAMHYWKNDLRDGMDDIVPTTTANPAYWQHMVTFAISIGMRGNINPGGPYPGQTGGAASWGSNKIDDMLHAAVNSRGTFAVASDPDGFREALEGALAAIIDRTGSFSNVAANSTSIDAGTRIFQAKYRTLQWTGEFNAYPVSSTGVGIVPTWQASLGIPLVASRKVISSDGDGNGHVFPAGATTAQVDALTRGPAADFPVTGANNAAYIAGHRTLEMSNAGTLRNRTHLLGDIVGSSPAFEPETKTVYVGANDGMLHAINSDDGSERFAFIPGLVDWAELGMLSRPDYQHRFFVDGPVVVTSKTQTPGQHILVGALGKGGKGLFALDVTEPGSFDASDVLWEVGDTVGGHMGLVQGAPIVAKLNNGTTALIVSNGLNSTNNRAALLIFNIATGALIAEIDTGEGTALNPNGLSPAVGWDSNANGTVDYVYAGDMLGNVWKFNLTSASPGTWGVANAGDPLFVATDSSGTRQPITAGLTVALHPQTYKTWLFFGTGRLMLNSDMTNMAVQSMYAFVDDGTGIARLGADANLTERTVVVADTLSSFPVRSFEANGPLPASSKGWYIDLRTPPAPGTAEGERVVAEGQVVGDILVFPSLIPTATDCQADGTGYINALNAFTGTSASSSYFDLDDDGLFNDETIADGGSNLPVGSVGLGVGMPTLPSLLRRLLVAGGSSGGVGSVPIRDARNVGRVSWREVIKE
ncbi:pilus assembly protein [Luteimonas changyuni]|uniref:pilus assembly protein n=1 Tax=Luteimonas sp. MJ145 TaxID=3129234 RepID=UPI0031BB3E31